MFRRIAIRLYARAAVVLAVLAAAMALAMAVWRDVPVPERQAALRAPEPTRLLVDRNGRFLADIPGEPGRDIGYWPLADLPPKAVAATLAAEDRRYFEHPGVDALAALRALWQNLVAGRTISGASTIPMQVARMQAPGPRDPARKLSEAKTALALVSRHGREAVLLHYFRIAPYGNRIHGIAYAARRYFRKPVQDLSWAETAFLAAVPQAPGRMNPCTPEGRHAAAARGERILRSLAERNAMPRWEFEAAVGELRRMPAPAMESRPPEAMHAVLVHESRLSRAGRAGGVPAPLLVTSSLDLDIQREASKVVRDCLRDWEELDAGNAAVAVVDRRTREVLAWVGSGAYADRAKSGAVDFARVPRPAGSTLKPLLFALALERGLISPASVMEDLRRAPGGIENADEGFLGLLLPREALGNSRNVPAARLLSALTPDQAYEFLWRLGLHGYARPAEHYGAGLAVGALPVTLEKLVRAYAALADDGKLADLAWTRVPDAASAASGRKILAGAAARQVSLFLADPMARLPGFPRMGATEYPFPVAVKTGTSSGYRDAWTVAYSARYLVGAWVGKPDATPMKGLSGYTAGAVIARKLLMSLHADQAQGLADLTFPPPEGHHPVAVCARSGARAAPGCFQTFVEWFPRGEEPPSACAVHAVSAVAGVEARGDDGGAEETFGRAAGEAERSYGPAALRWPRSGVGAARDLSEPGTSLPPSAALAGEAAKDPSVSVVSPEDASRIRFDPETPRELATLSLEAEVRPPVDQLVWYVDGVPFQVVDYPYKARWPIAVGEHTFQVRFPFSRTASRPVRVTVR